MNQKDIKPNEQPNEEWQKDRQGKEMRLWETGAKGNILAGWWGIIRSTISFFAFEGIFIYLWWTKQLPENVNFWTSILIIVLIFLATAYYIGLGIWEIYLGKSKLLRKQWTWWYTVITMPLAYIAFLIRFVYQPAGQTSPLILILIITSITLGFGALYYYTWTIKRKFEPAATEPIKEELQELSRWPVSKDRPTFIFLLSLILMFLSLPLIVVNGAMGSFIFDSSGPTGIVLAGVIVGFLAGITFLVSGIGLMRMKKFGFISAICATILLAVMTLLDMGTGGINIYLYIFIGAILADIYLFFEKEKLN